MEITKRGVIKLIQRVVNSIDILQGSIIMKGHWYMFKSVILFNRLEVAFINCRLRIFISMCIAIWKVADTLVFYSLFYFLKEFSKENPKIQSELISNKIGQLINMVN